MGVLIFVRPYIITPTLPLSQLISYSFSELLSGSEALSCNLSPLVSFLGKTCIRYIHFHYISALYACIYLVYILMTIQIFTNLPNLHTHFSPTIKFCTCSGMFPKNACISAGSGTFCSIFRLSTDVDALIDDGSMVGSIALGFDKSMASDC